MSHYVFSFGNGRADGDASQKNLLGGKGANLAEMARLGLPVPAGFTISTECCNDFFKAGWKLPESLYPEMDKAMQDIEKIMGMKFGDPDNPLLVSSRSGARQSMPGMMDTVLNIGLTERTLVLIRVVGEKIVIRLPTRKSETLSSFITSGWLSASPPTVWSIVPPLLYILSISK
jgi:phosphoenolpyruvate synthase/pyruvate phosphate dikinase